MTSVSILIPTLNRSDYLRRALTYYARLGFSGYICIGDSSNPTHLHQNTLAVEEFKSQLHIIHQIYPNPPFINDGMCLRELIDIAPTPYAVYSGDDDFLIPSGLEKCVDFLKSHPEYVAAQGVRFYLKLERDEAYANIATTYCPVGVAFEENTPLERWISYIRRPYSTQYYVHTVAAWRQMYKDITSISIRYLGPEILPCSVSVILGKVKELDSLSVICQVYNKAGWERQAFSMFDLFMHPDWHQSFTRLNRIIVEALLSGSPMDRGSVETIVEKELWLHFIFSALEQYEQRYGASNWPLLRSWALFRRLTRVFAPFKGLLSWTPRHLIRSNTPLPSQTYARRNLPEFLNQDTLMAREFTFVANLLKSG